MMIQLTSSFNKQIFALKADLVLVVERATDNPLVTNVVTALNSPKGMVSYSVLETPEEICAIVAAVNGQPPAPTLKPALLPAS
jgi:hypothetical protein